LRRGADLLNRAKNTRGFTLVELLIVISILIAVTGMSTFALLMFLAEDKLTNTGDRIELYFRQQRQHARTTRIDRRIIFDFVRRSMLVYSAGPNNTFGSYDAPDPDDVYEEEFTLDTDTINSLWFEKAVIKLSDYQGGGASAPYFPAYKEDPNIPPPGNQAQYQTGALRFARDGTIAIEKLVPATGALEESLNLDVPTSSWDTNKDADIIIAMKGEKRRLLIDVRPLSGSVDSKVAQLQPGGVQP
jgi:type II secretory pathway pseudopilin PulG